MKYFVYIVIALAVIFKFKYCVEQMRGLNVSLEQKIEKLEDNITTLKAEWTFLSKPSNIMRLAKEHLNMQYIEKNQITDQGYKNTSKNLSLTFSNKAP